MMCVDWALQDESAMSDHFEPRQFFTFYRLQSDDKAICGAYGLGDQHGKGWLCNPI
jgi:hypothetical protein